MRSSWLVRAALLAAFAASTAVSTVSAQKSTTRGFMVGAHLTGGTLTVQDGDPDSGGGIGARVGYGFDRHVTAYFEVDGIVFDVANPDFGGYWSMVHADLGARYNFANSLRRWVPFIEAAFGVRGVDVDDATVNGDSVGHLNFSGGAFSLGGGISFFVKEKLAIETLTKWSSGTFQQVRLQNVQFNNLDIDAKSFRFKLGLAWWP